MKLVAYSVVSPTPAPYMHLGYVSAQNWPHRQQIVLSSTAIVLMMLSTIAAVTGLAIVIGFIRRSRRILLVGGILLLCGVVGFIFSLSLPKIHMVPTSTAVRGTVQP